MARRDLQSDIANVQDALRTRLGVKGKTLGVQLRKAEKKLPRRLRPHATALAEAAQRAANPNMPPVNQKEAQRHANALLTHLGKGNLAKDKKRARWGWITNVVLNLCLFAALMAGAYALLPNP